MSILQQKTVDRGTKFSVWPNLCHVLPLSTGYIPHNPWTNFGERGLEGKVQFLGERGCMPAGKNHYHSAHQIVYNVSGHTHWDSASLGLGRGPGICSFRKHAKGILIYSQG